MSTIEEVFVAAMRAYAPLAGVVGTRILPMLPQGVTLPAVTYQLISRPQAESTPLGPNAPVEAISRYQIDCWADVNPDTSNGGYAQARSVANYVKAALNTMLGTGYDVIFDNTLDFPEPETLRFRRMVEVVIVHSESES